ncbi:MAG: hypothetical protein ACRQFF_02760 [Sphaerochaeta sp.]
MKINLKKLIKISAVLAVSAATLISCSSDSEEGMLRTIVNSQEEASYTISKSSFVYNDTTPESSYFVSVEDDGIYKASYTSLDDDADSNILDNVKRELYAGTDDLTQIQSIYTDETTSYVVYTEADSSTDSTSTTQLGTFDNSTTSDTFDSIAISKLTGTFKNLTPNGYIITTEFNDDEDDDEYETASLYIYSLTDLITANKNDTTLTPKVTISDIYSDYGSSRYLDYCVYYDNTTKNIESPTAYGTADGLIISLTDSDDDNDDYVASDRYYYFTGTELSSGGISFTGGGASSEYAFYIDADDDDDDAVNSAVVAAHGDTEGANALIITSNGNAYSGDIDDELNELDDRWDNSDNSDTFAVHLPSLFFNNDTNLYSDNSTDYLIGMNSYDYIYVYYADSDDDRYSTSSDIDVEYADDLNSSSDIIYIAPVESSDDVDTYWVATADNGYFTMTIDTTGIIEDSDSHSITEGFTYSGDTSD